MIVYTMMVNLTQLTMTSVMPLFFGRGPSAVVRFVVAVGIRVTIKCLTFRSYTHILEKVIEVF